MTANPPPPGHGQITLAAPAAGVLCTWLQHYRESRPAPVAVTFGDLGARYPGAIWPDCWHRTCPMCAACWQITRHVAQARRPGLGITDTTCARGDPRPARPAGLPRGPGLPEGWVS
jgi:hypothetical protein